MNDTFKGMVHTVLNSNGSMIDTIKKRTSVRTYDEQKITEEIFDQITIILKKFEAEPGPFGNYSRFQILKLDNEESHQGVKLGTYGFIKGHMAYLVAICSKENEAIIDMGYSFEKVILNMTQMGLGTCWIGGTFSRESFMKFIDLKDNEFIGAISPIGYGSDNNRIKEKIIRRTAGADNRKSWDQMFFKNDFSTELKKEHAGELEIAFEMVRWGPSASNKQPWRLMLVEEQDIRTIHFYLDFDPKYTGNTKLGYPIQKLDIGIAMSHFEVSAIELEKAGKWVFEEPDMKKINDQYEYVGSYSI